LKLSQNLISSIALSSLRVGDLVYFKRGQTVPLNVLVLDSKDDDVKLQVWRGSG
jgi:magnesium-transporting ATPase (P-type)